MLEIKTFYEYFSLILVYFQIFNLILNIMIHFSKMADFNLQDVLRFLIISNFI
jgi:hypothetical protein